MDNLSELKDKLTDWFDGAGQASDLLASMGSLLLLAIWYILGPCLLYLIIVHLCLLVRSLRLIYGRRVAPDGQLAVVITGATSGFGLATAKRLYGQGFTIFACYYNDQELGYAELLDLKLRPFQVAGKKLHSNFQRPSLFLIKMDVRSSDSIERSAQEILHLLSVHNMKLHCLLNNAGTSTDGAFELSTRDSIRNLIDTNLTGLISVTREFILRIIKDKGRVVNVSSGVYQFPAKAMALYGATKSGVAYYSDALHADLKSYGASCNAIVPGNSLIHSNILYTRMSHFQTALGQLTEEERQTYRKTIELSACVLDHLFRMKLEQSPHEDARKMADIYRIQLPQMSADGRPTKVGQTKLEDLDEFKNRSWWFRINQWFVSRCDGSSGSNVSLENSHSIQGFEDAIRLVRAPRRMYAGNRFYYHISGPILQYMPPVLCSLFGNLISNNLAMPR